MENPDATFYCEVCARKLDKTDTDHAMVKCTECERTTSTYCCAVKNTSMCAACHPKYGPCPKYGRPTTVRHTEMVVSNMYSVITRILSHIKQLDNKVAEQEVIISTLQGQKRHKTK